MHLTELRTLRENLKRARKLLAASPRHLREERGVEVEKLERAVKRAESSVNRDKQEKIQENALNKAKEEEKQKRKQGKGEWYMKNGVYSFLERPFQ
jgi:ribosomal RNA-processing protein 36